MDEFLATLKRWQKMFSAIKVSSYILTIRYYKDVYIVTCENKNDKYNSFHPDIWKALNDMSWQVSSDIEGG